MSTSDAVRAKINTMIRDAVVADYPGTLIAYENHKFDQPRGTPWVHIAYNPGKSMRKDIGANRVFRHMGIVIVNIMVPEDSGTADLLGMCDTVFYALADASYALPGDNGYLKLCEAERRNRGTINGWYVYNVQVEYYQDVAAP